MRAPRERRSVALAPMAILMALEFLGYWIGMGAERAFDRVEGWTKL